MIPTELFSLAPAPPDAQGGARARLLKNGAPTGLVLPGRALEAQFETADGRALLFLVHDAPFEEQLEIVLLDRAGAVEDSLRLLKAYAPGLLRDLAAGPGEAVSFRFHGQARRRVEVSPRPRLALPFGGPRSGASRPLTWPLRWRRSLALSALDPHERQRGAPPPHQDRAP
jgi:hypothetical protein